MPKETHNNQRLPSETGKQHSQAKEYTQMGSYHASMPGFVGKKMAQRPLTVQYFDPLKAYGGSVTWFIEPENSTKLIKAFFPRIIFTPANTHGGIFAPFKNREHYLDQTARARGAHGQGEFPFYVGWSENFAEYTSFKYPIIQHVRPVHGDWNNPFVTERTTFAIKTNSDDLLAALQHEFFGGAYGIDPDMVKQIIKSSGVSADPTGDDCAYAYSIWKALINTPTFFQLHGGDPEVGYAGSGPGTGIKTDKNTLINVDRTYYDHNFSLDTPFVYNSIQGRSYGGLQTMYVKELPEYNFYLRCFEEAQTLLANQGLASSDADLQYDYTWYDAEKAGTDKAEALAAAGLMDKDSWYMPAELLTPNMYLFLSEQEYLDNSNDFNIYGVEGTGTPYSLSLIHI